MKKDRPIINLETSEINPSLIRTYAYNLDRKDWIIGKFPSRIVESYEFEFIIESNGYMNLEGNRYVLKPGDLCLRKPGDLTRGESPYSCYMISFSMTQNHKSSFEPFYHNEIFNQLPPVLHTKNPKYYEMIFENILDQYIKNEPSSNLLIRSLILEIIYAAYQECKQDYLPSSAYHMIIKKAIDYIENHYGEKISLNQISQIVNLSPSHFQKIFKQTMNRSPNEFLLNLRLTKAKELLLITDESITDIAYRSGFESHAYFTYVFHKILGVSPSTYRKSHQKP
ncbi:MAG: helix-turn-helix transcriptional regulator [Acholeplasmataceae bacterium]|nr:helix-turn-helix transcriptional regulator [Acholeplasmataceae bacterium]